MRNWTGVLAATALAGCVTTGTTLIGTETVTSAYETGSTTFGTSEGPVYVDFRFRVYESTGLTAMCIIGVGRASLAQGDLFRLWFKESTVTVNGDEFGKGDFVRLVNPDPANNPPQAQCVRSDLAWKSGYARGRVNFAGGQVRIVQ
jgi:hypothetical protein